MGDEARRYRRDRLYQERDSARVQAEWEATQPLSRKPRVQNRDAIRQAIHVWIAEDIGFAAKVTITPDKGSYYVD